MYFLFKIYFEVLFSVSGAPNGSYFLQYFNNNFGIFIGSMILLGVLVIILSLLNIAYPILYLQLIQEKGDNNFTASDLIIRLKQNTGRLLKFFIGSVFILFPIMIISFVILVLLCFILIGIPLIMIAMPAFIAWGHLSLYTYLTEKTGFFESLKKGFSLLKQEFWAVTATTFIMLMLIQIVQAFITWLPYGIVMVILKTTTGVQELYSPDHGDLPLVGLVMTVFFLFAIILSYLFNNLIIVNQGIIYYSLREENENLTSISQIDLIGTDND
ncbi:MAG: hypothetical protein ABI793_07735, partial [Flavobacterium sp.]